jgi:hypothetical protein
MYAIIGGDQKQYGPVTTAQMRDWIAQGRVNSSTLVQAAGTTDWKPLAAFPELAAASGPATSAAPPPMPAPASDGGVAVVIPYKNPKALIAYYLGVFSLIPCVGIPLGIAAVILGILGLKFAAANPTARGKVHAWVGIILGGLCALGYTLLPLYFYGGKR